MTPENRILTLAAEGRIIRNTWSRTDEQGRQLLCLYTALAGDPKARPETCPAHLAPQWVAHLMPWWDDAGTVERWPEVVQQVGELAPRLGELSGDIGRRAFARCQLVTLRAVVPVAGSSLPAVERVVALWERVLAGDEPTSGEWAAVARAAWVAKSAAKASAKASAAKSAAKSARAAARAAEAAAKSAAKSARAAARAAEAAAAAAAWAEAAAAVLWAAKSAKSSVDAIIFGHLAAIREELGRS